MNLSDNLKKIRKEHNLSQEQLAEQLGVSRQAVSKWESGGAYPEMDKVLQLCQIFNLNIDDLLNQDIKEINNSKQEKSNINKIIDDFLDYITKTIDMFSCMKFKEKIKCIFEQLLITGIIALLLLIIGSICGNIIQSILQFMPDKTYSVVYCILEGIYLSFGLVLGIILILHIFKVRYLDYYVIVKEENCEKYEEPIDKKEENNEIQDKLKQKEDKKILLEKKQEKVIIRDPKHSEYKFISGLLKILLFTLKSITFFIAIGFCITLITLVIITVLSFVFVKTGLIFIGSFITLISCIIINLITLIILYNFITSKKNKKGRLALFFIISLILIGIGIGIIFIGASEFEVIANTDSEIFVREEYTIQMQDNLFLEDWHNNIEYIESDNNDIKIVYKHTPYYNIKISYNVDNYVYFYSYPDYDNIMDILKDSVKDINNKKIIDYSNYKIYIYTSQENIQKLRDNKDKYFDSQYEHTIDDLYKTIEEKNQEINDLQEALKDKESRIFELEEELENYNQNY